MIISGANADAEIDKVTSAQIEDAGLEVFDRSGLSPSAAKGFKLGGSEALNYLVAARWRG